MKLESPSFKFLAYSDLDAMPSNQFKLIEYAGRICYNSIDKIDCTSSAAFIANIKSKGHTSVLEHGSLYLKFTLLSLFSFASIIFYIKCLFNRYTIVRFNRIYSNNRVLFETFNDKLPSSLKYFIPDINDKFRRFTIQFTCDRAIANELVRHRVASFAQQSTRYFNYTKDKFDNQITFIKPFWLENKENTFEFSCFESFVRQSERSYMYLIKKFKWQPQQARAILPNCLKTELVMTASANDWRQILQLRTSKAAHPQMTELTIPLLLEFQNINSKLFDV